MERAPQLFEKTHPADKKGKEIEKLYTKIGQLEMEREYLKKNLNLIASGQKKGSTTNPANFSQLD